MVYGLRYYYRLLGMNKNAIALPSLKKDSKLPVILNQQELKELFAAPTLLKQRIVLALIYSAGLCGQEVINIRQSKYKKDRIVPLAHSMAAGLKKYLTAENPHIWLFNGKEPGGRYSVRGLSWVMRENLKKTSITKDMNLHSLRHSYATHLPEQGLNIVTLKELLGHAQITTTMIYHHVAQCPLYPHIHCIVPAAGYTLDGGWKNIGPSGNYLYPVHQLSNAFKGKLLDSLKRTLKKRNDLSLFSDKIQQAYHARWVVHCESALAGAVHVLPVRFVKIRRYGIYNHTAKRNL
ncbi:MAG: tyrosine-type recombinase/integrase, partial [Bacteroidota bacterium]